MTLVLCVILFGLAFEYINGFHDTANAIATVVSTRVLSPRQAVCLAAVCNLIGAHVGHGRGHHDRQRPGGSRRRHLAHHRGRLAGGHLLEPVHLVAGLPSSSSHALIGGLCGATVASAGGDFSVIRWSVVTGQHGPEGLWPKVVLPMIASPLLGLPDRVPRDGPALGDAAQLAAAPRQYGLRQAATGQHRAHGAQPRHQRRAEDHGHHRPDALDRHPEGPFRQLASWLRFLHTPQFEVHMWVKVICSLTMAAGTAAGGWRIIQTMGHRMVKLQPIHGFAAETAAATVIQVASHWGIPLSTTHVISGLDPGRGRHPAIQRGEMADRGADGLGLGLHAAGHRPDRLLARMPAAFFAVGFEFGEFFVERFFSRESS